MSLHQTVGNKETPSYYCIENVENGKIDIGGSICGTFHIGWTYQLSYVENRVPKHLISKYFTKY